jgi:hypothetical protein
MADGWTGRGSSLSFFSKDSGFAGAAASLEARRPSLTGSLPFLSKIGFSSDISTKSRTGTKTGILSSGSGGSCVARSGGTVRSAMRIACAPTEKATAGRERRLEESVSNMASLLTGQRV